MYSDTDSIITDCNLRQYPDLMERFMWDGCGKELGALKNEAVDLINDKKVLEEQIEHDGGEIYFDECQILGPKQYSLKKTFVNNKTVEIVKCKGIAKKSMSYSE